MMRGWKFSDPNNCVLGTVPMPGSVVSKPKAYAEVDQVVDDIKKALEKIFNVEDWHMESELRYCTEETRERILWVFGGSIEVANYFLIKERRNFPTYKLFFIADDPTKTPNYYRQDVYGYDEISPDTEVGDCGICLMPLTAKDNAGLSCNHLICFDCVTDHITHKVKDFRTEPSSFVCPGKDCKLNYNAYHVWRVGGSDMDSPIFTKFLEINTTKAFESSPFVKYCSNKECNNMIIAKGFKRRYVCTSCGTHSCSKCCKKYHKIPICKEKKFDSTGFSIKTIFIT